MNNARLAGRTRAPRRSAGSRGSKDVVQYQKAKEGCS
jgi:hypothetical protein